MKAAIFYFTTGGNTEAMADILGTALTDNGVEVLKKAVSDASAEDFEGVDVFACLIGGRRGRFSLVPNSDDSLNA